MNRRGRGERGQSLVEFALVVPMLLLVLFAIIDFGRLFQGYITLTNATREGARIAAVGGTDSDISARVLSAASGLSGVTVSPASYPDAGGDISGNSVVVTASAPMSFITPIGALITMVSKGANSVGGSFSLTSSSNMRIE